LTERGKGKARSRSMAGKEREVSLVLPPDELRELRRWADSLLPGVATLDDLGVDQYLERCRTLAPVVARLRAEIRQADPAGVVSVTMYPELEWLVEGARQAIKATIPVREAKTVKEDEETRRRVRRAELRLRVLDKLVPLEGERLDDPAPRMRRPP
jgi:hypothetical protein